MTALWWRSWHGAPTDSKWLAVAKRAGVAPGMVSAFAWALLDHASQQDGARGCVEGFDIESYSAFSGFSETDITNIWKAMDEKGLIEGGKFVAWEKRQPQREDHSSDRVRDFRSRNAVKRNETHGNAILDKIREDKIIKINREDSKPRKKIAKILPIEWKPSDESKRKGWKLGLSDSDITRETERFRNHARQTARTCVLWDAAFDNWCIKAAEILGRSPPSDTTGQFVAPSDSPEFRAWMTHARDTQQKSLVRELSKRELEGRAFAFESQWPPGNEP